jgi:hypothetical protein
MLLILFNFGTLSFGEFFGQLNNGQAMVSNSTYNWIAICLFIGAMGKSAQIPLYTWLPDAMAGPTPVSALIHAATMVTAGIYLVVRSNFLYHLSPSTLDFILVIGLATSLIAAFIGLRATLLYWQPVAMDALISPQLRRILAPVTAAVWFYALACHCRIWNLFSSTQPAFTALAFSSPKARAARVVT